MFLDVMCCKVRLGGWWCPRAVVIATRVRFDGRREVLPCVVGDIETEPFWTEFLRELRDRGLGGVQRGRVSVVSRVLGLILSG